MCNGFIHIKNKYIICDICPQKMFCGCIENICKECWYNKYNELCSNCNGNCKECKHSECIVCINKDKCKNKG